MALALEAVTHAIIGAAIDVHRRLGPGFLESIYANALCVELRRRSGDWTTFTLRSCARTCARRDSNMAF